MRAIPARYRSPLAVAVALLGLSAASSFHVPLLPEITRSLDLSVGDVGVFATVFAVGRLAADLPAGRLIDARGASATLAGGAVALGLGTAVLTAADARGWLLASASVIGVGSALANTSGMAYFSTISSNRRRAKSMSVYAVGLLGGQAIGPAVSGLLEGLGGWRVATGAVPLLVLAIGVVLWAFGPRRTSQSAARPAGEGEGVTVLSAGARVILGLVPFAVSFGLIGVGQTLVPVIGAVEHDLRPAVIGTVLGIAGVARLVGALLAGVVADRKSRKSALVPGLVLQAAGIGMVQLLPTVPGWVAATVVMSAASYGVVIGATVLGDGVPRDELGRRLGRYRLVGDLGFVAGPAAAAHFLGQGQNASMLGLASGLLMVAAILVVIGVPETHEQQRTVFNRGARPYNRLHTVRTTSQEPPCD
ncbi:MFS transporter [Euzebya pacifica]|uniref:MFS transporter n=1 Tax=Euzebya pacifica TaxID=1608957 RepID=UPI0030F8B07E